MIDKIKAEIERRTGILTRVYAEQVERKDEEMQTYYRGKIVALEELRSFIESLEKEQKSNEGSKMVLSDATEKLWQSIPHRTHAIYDRIKAYGLFCYEQGRKYTTCLESQGLDEAAEEWCKRNNKGIALCADKKSHYLVDGIDAFKACAEWMVEQGYNREAEVKEDAGGYPYIDEIELYDYDNDKPLAKKGDNVRIQITKL